jgi:hypothetical protein
LKGLLETATVIIEYLKGRPSGSRCVFCTAVGYNELIKHGHKPKICFGFAAFSVNKEPNGIVSFGAGSDHQYMEDVPNVVKGHYWLEVGGKIIDFSLMFLDDTVQMLDDISGIKTGEVLLSKSPVVSKLKNKPLIKLQKGAIAHHYNLKQVVDSELFFNKHGIKGIGH